jgi:mRNA interferase RelE/StbE
MNYTVLVSDKVRKTLRAIPAKDYDHIWEKINELAVDPRPQGCKKLAGEDDLYRVRAGNYRIIYSIEDAQLIVEIVKTGYRRDVYR